MLFSPRHCKDVKYSQESLTAELDKLMAEKEESQQRIQDLEEEIKILNDRDNGANMELERRVFQRYRSNICPVYLVPWA